MRMSVPVYTRRAGPSRCALPPQSRLEPVCRRDLPRLKVRLACERLQRLAACIEGHREQAALCSDAAPRLREADAGKGDGREAGRDHARARLGRWQRVAKVVHMRRFAFLPVRALFGGGRITEVYGSNESLDGGALGARCGQSLVVRVEEREETPLPFVEVPVPTLQLRVARGLGSGPGVGGFAFPGKDTL